MNAKSKASNIIRSDFYVDDLITGGATFADITAIKHEVSAILNQGQFHLRKWYSNHHEFLKSIAEDEREKTIMINNNSVVKALGIIWNANTDTVELLYNVAEGTEKKLR